MVEWELRRSATFVNEGLKFDDPNVSFEDLLAQKEKLLDLSAGREMSGLIRCNGNSNTIGSAVGEPTFLNQRYRSK